MKSPTVSQACLRFGIRMFQDDQLKKKMDVILSKIRVLNVET
ncbi:MAG: hypothetical protein ACUVWO_16790 [Thermodesulfobacteriota bacterium]